MEVSGVVDPQLGLRCGKAQRRGVGVHLGREEGHARGCDRREEPRSPGERLLVRATRERAVPVWAEIELHGAHPPEPDPGRHRDEREDDDDRAARRCVPVGRPTRRSRRQRRPSAHLARRILLAGHMGRVRAVVVPARGRRDASSASPSSSTSSQTTSTGTAPSWRTPTTKSSASSSFRERTTSRSSASSRSRVDPGEAQAPSSSPATIRLPPSRRSRALIARECSCRDRGRRAPSGSPKRTSPSAADLRGRRAPHQSTSHSTSALCQRLEGHERRGHCERSRHSFPYDAARDPRWTGQERVARRLAASFQARATEAMSSARPPRRSQGAYAEGVAYHARGEARAR